MSGYGRLTGGSQLTAYSVDEGATIPTIERAPADYICLSVFTVFFFCPIGLAALCQSFRVEQRYGAGNVDGAQSASRCALILNIIGIVLGSLVIAAVVITVAVIYSD